MEQQSGIESKTSPTGLAYLTCGPPQATRAVVCIHGWGCQSSDYRPLFEQLLQHDLRFFRVIAMDLPGYGKTPKEVCSEPSISVFATKVLQFCQEIGVDDVVIVGHSMGCRVALDVWAQDRMLPPVPEGRRPIVSGVVFLDGSHYKLRPPLFSWDRSELHKPKEVSLEEQDRLKREAFKRMFSHRTPAEFQTAVLQHIISLDKEYDKKVRKSHIDYDMTRMDEVLDQLGRSTTKLMNMQSTDVDAQSQRVPLKKGERSRWMEFLQKKVPQAEQVVVDDCAHFPQVDRADVVKEKLLRFISYADVTVTAGPVHENLA
jgi:pimeloyl-ACP methyl ester carboxylesterase